MIRHLRIQRPAFEATIVAVLDVIQAHRVCSLHSAATDAAELHLNQQANDDCIPKRRIEALLRLFLVDTLRSASTEYGQ